ncbi:sensor histidine kinase [Nocardioides aromaticivorans]|uniref:histidine kinase n=2 Tax=Nocardioides aromaticivorans TaxID=200618 RepID=A0ABX7PST7_9ACTN|nr:sensor histidine kinase [Nocardioides aromaticivorans]
MSDMSRQRRVGGLVVAVLAPLLLVPVLVPLREQVNLASDVALFLVVVVASALVGGPGPAVVAAVLGATLLNFWFTPPFHTFAIDDANNVVALIAFVVVAVMVGWVVDLAARRAEAAAAAAGIEAADRVRAALLTAVGHDLRTPLAAAKASVSGLRSTDVSVSPQDHDELLATADDALDRLAALVGNLLDMSRLQAGAMPVRLRPVALGDVLASALDDLGVAPRGVVVDVPDDLPAVVTDPGLLERVLVNLVANAQRFSPAGRPPLVRAAVARDGSTVVVEVVDRGPGIAAEDAERVFQPFQRLGDTDNSTGIGLGLAVARGLTDAVDGDLVPGRTAGGGLTMTLSLPAEPRTGESS